MTHSSTPRKKPTRRHDQGGAATAAPIIAVMAGIVLLFAAFLVFGSGILGSPQPGEPAPTQSAGGQDDSPAATLQDARVSFVAVGDNLPETSIGAYADACAGEAGDGLYDYRPIYAAVKPYVESADLAYIKQETHLGGDEIGPRGWPSFNTTDAMADAIVDAGFDLVASASNHAYDWGYFGAVEHSRSVWNQKPVAFTGTAANEEEAQAIPVVERNGISFALLDYTYGVNGYAQGDLPSYAVNFIDEERIAADVARAHEMADIVLVAMHWGTENLTEADAEQQRLAQFLADLEVDVVLGSHPPRHRPARLGARSLGTPNARGVLARQFRQPPRSPRARKRVGGHAVVRFRARRRRGLHPKRRLDAAGQPHRGGRLLRLRPQGLHARARRTAHAPLPA